MVEGTQANIISPEVLSMINGIGNEGFALLASSGGGLLRASRLEIEYLKGFGFIVVQPTTGYLSNSAYTKIFTEARYYMALRDSSLSQEYKRSLVEYRIL